MSLRTVSQAGRNADLGGGGLRAPEGFHRSFPCLYRLPYRPASVRSDGRGAPGPGVSLPGEGSPAGSKTVATRPIRPNTARTIMAIP